MDCYLLEFRSLAQEFNSKYIHLIDLSHRSFIVRQPINSGDEDE